MGFWDKVKDVGGKVWDYSPANPMASRNVYNKAQNFVNEKVGDFLYGDIEDSQAAADRAARAQYDTAQLNPRKTLAMQMASEGIRDREMRESAVNRIMATDENSMAAMYGGNAAAMIAGASQTSDLKSRALAQYEYDLAIQDAQAKLQGEIEYANTTGDMLKMKAALKTTLELNKAQASAAIGARKQELLGNVFGLAGTVAGYALGGPAGGAIGAKVGQGTAGKPTAVDNTITMPYADDFVQGQFGPEGGFVKEKDYFGWSIPTPVVGNNEVTPSVEDVVQPTATEQILQPLNSPTATRIGGRISREEFDANMAKYKAILNPVQQPKQLSFWQKILGEFSGNYKTQPTHSQSFYRQ